MHHIAVYIFKSSVSDSDNCNDLVTTGKAPLSVIVENSTGDNTKESILDAKEAFVIAVSRVGLTKSSPYTNSIHNIQNPCKNYVFDLNEELRYT